MPFTFKLSKRLALMKASLVPAAAAVLVACQLQDRRGITDPPLPSNSVVQVVTSPDTVTLEPSVTQQFRAYGRTEAGDSVAITMTWSATDGAISSGGLYTAAPFQGDFEVTATALQASGTASMSGTPQGVARGYSMVHVRANPQLAQVVVVPRSVSLGTGGTQQFVAYGRLNNGDSVAVSVTWSAQGGTISSSGLYVAGSIPGGYVVTATASGITGTAILAISDISVASVAVSPASATVSVGSTRQFSAVVKDANGNVLSGRTVTWATSSSAVATVSASGLVTGVAVGAATITATSEGQSGSATVTVTNPPVASVTVSPAAPNVYMGGAVQLTATPKDAAGNPLSGRTVTWTTSNSAVATVSASGLVTGLTLGSVTITATSEGQSGTAAVTVSTVPVASVEVSPPSANVPVGGTTQLSATPQDPAGNPLAGRAVTWTSPNPGIATVSAAGLVTGVAVGSATITATSEGKSGSATVTVTKPPVASVTVSPAASNVSVGGAVQLTATPKDASGNVLTGRTVTWTTSSSAVATVSASGLVTGVAVGAATITATSEGQSGTAAVTVSTVPVASVAVSPPSANVVVGGTLQLSATPKDASGNALTGRTVTWTTSNSTVATVSAAGLVTGVASGAATITATSEGQNASAAITVANVPVASVSVSPTAPNIYVGGAVQLTATPKDASGNVLTGRTVIWTTSSSAVATVSASGLVTGVAVGAVTITATSEGQSGTAAVTVSTVPVASVAVSPPSANVLVGGTTQLSATPQDAAGNPLAGRAVTWTSANPGIATVSAAGLVTGVAAGTVTIIATSETKSGSAAISVANVPVASVVVSPVTAVVLVGATAQLTATLKDAAGNVLSGRSVTWASSAPTVATVSSTGVVTGVAAGAATITATSEGKRGTAAVTVNPVPVASVSVNPASAGIPLGQWVQLTATLLDANGLPLSGRSITWASSAPAVAAVSTGGLVTGVAVGTATITATSEGKSGTAAVTVTPGSAVPPGTVLTLTVASTTDTSVTLSFTEVDDGTGQPANYDVRYAVGSISWGSAPSVTRGTCATPVTGSAIGATRSCTVLGLAPATAYQLQLVAFRGTLSVNAVFGALSNVAAGTTTASAALPVASVAVSPATASVVVGQTVQLTATPKDASGNPLSGRVVAWSSANSAVASVSTSGLVQGIALGSATITATSEGKNGTASITVANLPPAGSEPVFTSATDQLVLQDNMDAYTSAAALYTGTVPNQHIIQATVGDAPNPDAADQLITPGRGGTGTALRIAYAGTYQEGHAWDTYNAPYTGDLVTTVIQYYGRVTTSAPIPASNLRVKWLEGWHQGAVGGRVQWNTADRPLLYSPDTWWQVYDLTSTSSGATSGQGTQPIPPSLNTLADGQWHRYTHTYRPNSGPGTRDGFVRMWVDGIKIIDVSAATIGVTPPGGYKPWCDGTDVDAIAVRAGIQHVAFGAVLTTTVPSFTMDLDDFTQWTRP